MSRTTSTRRLALRIAMCSGYFLVLLDVTAVNVALPGMEHALATTLDQLQWVVDAYAIVLAAAMLVCGSIGDAYGHRRVVLCGLALFGVASLLCGAAPTTGWLIGARAAQGCGAALLLPSTLAVISRSAVDDADLARGTALWAAIGGIALPAGPLLGGVLTQTLGWRAVFLLNVPVILLALPAVLGLLTAEPATRSDRRGLDMRGAVVAALMLASVTFTFIEAGRPGQPTPLLAAAAAAAAVLIPSFYAVERTSARPMLPLSLFRRPGFTVATAIAGTMNLGTLGVLFLLTQLLQTIQHRSALAAGLLMLPGFLPMAVLPPLVGRWVARVGPRIPVAFGLVAAGAGLTLLVRVDAATPAPALIPALLLWGGGLAVLTPAVVAAAMGSVSAERAGLASAVSNTARQAGGAIGIAALGALAGQAGIVAGLHRSALVAAVLYAAAAVLALIWMPGLGITSTECPHSARPATPRPGRGRGPCSRRR